MINSSWFFCPLFPMKSGWWELSLTREILLESFLFGTPESHLGRSGLCGAVKRFIAAAAKNFPPELVTL
jgi:hypothetical protein